MKIITSEFGEQFVMPRRTRTERQCDRARGKRATRREIAEALS